MGRRRTDVPMKKDPHGLFDDGSAKPRVILALFEKGSTLPQIVCATGFSESEVRKVLQKAGKKVA